MSNKDYLLSLLQIEDQEIRNMTLDEMLNSVETDWFWYISFKDQILDLTNQETELKEKVHLLLSKIFFFANDMENSVEHALLASTLFDCTQRDLYSDNVLTLIISRYIDVVNDKLEMDNEVFAKYKKIVEQILNVSLQENRKEDNQMLLGLAVETKNFELFKAIIKQSSDKDLKMMFKFMGQRVYSSELKFTIMNIFLQEFEIRKSRMFYELSETFTLLGKAEEHADFIIQSVLGKFLIRSGHLNYIF